MPGGGATGGNGAATSTPVTPASTAVRFRTWPSKADTLPRMADVASKSWRFSDTSMVASVARRLVVSALGAARRFLERTSTPGVQTDWMPWACWATGETLTLNLRSARLNEAISMR